MDCPKQEVTMSDNRLSPALKIIIIIVGISVAAITLGYFISSSNPRIYFGKPTDTSQEEAKNREEAKARLSALLDRAKQEELSFDVRYELGSTYMALGEHDKAVDAFKRAAEIDPSNARALTGLGKAYEAQGDYDKAIDYYRKAIMTDPENMEAYYNLGSAYKDAGRTEEGLKEIENIKEEVARKIKVAADVEGAKRIEPDDAVAGNMAFYSGMGMQDKALEELDELEKENEESEEDKDKKVASTEGEDESEKPEETEQDGEGKDGEKTAEGEEPEGEGEGEDVGKADTIGDDKEGETPSPYDIFKEIPKEEAPPTAMEHVVKGVFYKTNSQYGEAIEEYLAAVSIDPQNYPALLGLGNCYYALGNDPNSSLEYYIKATNVQATNAAAFENMGQIYETHIGGSEGKQKAAAAYATSLELDGSKGDLWLKLGLLYNDLEKYEEAVPAFNNAILKKTGLAQAYAGLVVAYRQMGTDYNAQQIEALKKLIEYNSDSAQLKYDLGVLYISVNQKDDAINAFLGVIAIAGSDLHLAAYKHLAKLYKQKQNPDYVNAALYYNEAIKLTTGNIPLAKLYYSLGIVLRNDNKPLEAIDAFKHAFEKDPNHASAIFEAGKLYVQQEELANAESMYEKLLPLNSELASQLKKEIDKLKTQLEPEEPPPPPPPPSDEEEEDSGDEEKSTQDQTNKGEKIGITNEPKDSAKRGVENAQSGGNN